MLHVAEVITDVVVVVNDEPAGIAVIVVVLHVYSVNGLIHGKQYLIELTVF